MSDSALSLREEAPVAGVDDARQKSEAVAQVEAQVFMAKQYPRDEDAAYQKMIRACERPSFAIDATYSYSRGGNRIEGGSIQLAREMKRHWGNIYSGIRVVREDSENLYGEAFAWDLETNTYDARQFTANKYIWRKANRKTGTPAGFRRVGSRDVNDADLERDFREKVYNIGGRAERECIFHVLPSDYRADCEQTAMDTVHSKVRDDPEAGRKLILRGMGKLNITADMIEEYLGCKVAQAAPAQIEELRVIYQQVNSGEKTWAEAAGLEEPEPEPNKAAIPVDEIRKSDSPNRGHDGANPDVAPEEADETTASLKAGAVRLTRMKLSHDDPGLSEFIQASTKSTDAPGQAQILLFVGRWEGTDEDLQTGVDEANERLAAEKPKDEKPKADKPQFGAKPK